MALSAQQVAAIRSSLPPGVSYSDEQIQQMYSQGAGSAEFQNSKEAKYYDYFYSRVNQLDDTLKAELQAANTGMDAGVPDASLVNRIAAKLGISPEEAAYIAKLGRAIRYGSGAFTDKADNGQEGGLAFFLKESARNPAEAAFNQAINDGKLRSGQGGAEAAGGPAPGDVAARAKITAQIQEFYDRMNAPVTDANGNITEPIVKQLATIGRNMGLQGASGRGIQGGAASLTAGASAQANALPYLQQRASLAQQANQMLQSGQISYEQLNQDTYRLDLQAQQLNNAQAIGGYNGQVAGAQGTGAIIGGALGGLAGGLAGQGNPLAIGAGLSTGASLGGAIGGQSVQKPTLAPYRPYSGS